MSEGNKNTLKVLAGLLLAFGTFVAIAYLVPDGSIIKKIVGIIISIGLLIGILYSTPLGNPIKAIIRKIQERKK